MGSQCTHWWNSETLCQGRETLHKGMYVLGIHFINSRKVNLLWLAGGENQCFQSSGLRIKGFKGSSGSDRQVLDHDWDGGYKTANLNPNSWHCNP